jgi:hypothetical protein
MQISNNEEKEVLMRLVLSEIQVQEAMLKKYKEAVLRVPPAGVVKSAALLEYAQGVEYRLAELRKIKREGS